MTIDPEVQKQAAVLGGVQGAGCSAHAAKESTKADPQAGAAFRALLDKIEENARALDRASEELHDPRRLGEAVSSARQSVQEAVLLGSDLLEAYRAAQQRADAGAPGDARRPEDPQDGSRGGQ